MILPKCSPITVSIRFHWGKKKKAKHGAVLVYAFNLSIWEALAVRSL